MSIYRLADQGEVEGKVIEILKRYWFEDIRFKTSFKRFGNLSISKVHPFTRILSSSKGNRPKDVLPAISLALVDDTSSNVALNRGSMPVEIDKNLLKELKNQKYQLNTENVFDELIKWIDKGNKLFAQQINRRFAQKLVIEVWSINDTIKDFLYEGTKDCLDFYADELYSFGMENLMVNGKKDGDYNFDFGDVMYGAMITLSFVIPNMIFIIDTEWKEVGSVTHSIDDISVDAL